jgi:hypothetical protein
MKNEITLQDWREIVNYKIEDFGVEEMKLARKALFAELKKIEEAGEINLIQGITCTPDGAEIEFKGENGLRAIGINHSIHEKELQSINFKNL